MRWFILSWDAWGRKVISISCRRKNFWIFKLIQNENFDTFKWKCSFLRNELGADKARDISYMICYCIIIVIYDTVFFKFSAGLVQFIFVHHFYS